MEKGGSLALEVDMVTCKCRPGQVRSGATRQGERIFSEDLELEPASRLCRNYGNRKRMQQAPTSCPCPWPWPSSSSEMQIQDELVRVRRVAQKRCQVLSCAFLSCHCLG